MRHKYVCWWCWKCVRNTLISLAHYFLFIYRNKLQLLRMRFVPQASRHTQWTSTSTHPRKVNSSFYCIDSVPSSRSQKSFEAVQKLSSTRIAAVLVIFCVSAGTRFSAPSIASRSELKRKMASVNFQWDSGRGRYVVVVSFTLTQFLLPTNIYDRFNMMYCTLLKHAQTSPEAISTNKNLFARRPTLEPSRTTHSVYRIRETWTNMNILCLDWVYLISIARLVLLLWMLCLRKFEHCLPSAYFVAYAALVDGNKDAGSGWPRHCRFVLNKYMVVCGP